MTEGFDQLIPAATADVATALERMLDYDSVVDCSSVSVGKLAEKLKAEKAVTSKAAKELVQRLLIAGGAASKIRRSGKLMRVKPKKKEGQ
jgi:putative NADH-flavin reductase